MPWQSGAGAPATKARSRASAPKWLRVTRAAHARHSDAHRRNARLCEFVHP
jgi:hypothetical protein